MGASSSAAVVAALRKYLPTPNKNNHQCSRTARLAVAGSTLLLSPTTKSSAAQNTEARDLHPGCFSAGCPRPTSAAKSPDGGIDFNKIELQRSGFAPSISAPAQNCRRSVRAVAVAAAALVNGAGHAAGGQITGPCALLPPLPRLPPPPPELALLSVRVAGAPPPGSPPPGLSSFRKKADWQSRCETIRN